MGDGRLHIIEHFVPAGYDHCASRHSERFGCFRNNKHRLKEGIRMKRIASLLFVLFLGLSPLASLAAPVNINTADAKTLDTALVGVGPKTAKAIVDHRGKNGSFKSVDDLLKVKGIGPALLEKNRSNIIVK